MADPMFVEPRSVDVDVHRWYALITVVDRFGTTRVFKASADSEDTGGDGISWEELDLLGGGELP